MNQVPNGKKSEKPADSTGSGGERERDRTPDRLFLALWVCASLLLTACTQDASPLKQGDPAPPFELMDLDGHLLSFPADSEGRVVAVRFWADWCPFCEGEMRSIEPLFSEYRDRGLDVIAVNVRQDRETAARFVEPLGISYSVLLDIDGAVARRYGVSALPTTFVLDRRGKLATRILGESSPELLEAIVEKLL